MKTLISDVIETNPQICGGEPVIKGTRILLRVILDSLASGESLDSILENFPAMTPEQLNGVIAFAASSASEDIPYMSFA